mmetsp:Transcript_26311/g.78425  ORF Transcript_26311/g.78425 Transcript_26311/m.78425 type:complete len:238 (+) Transcript_26311:51-764(+)
MLASGRTRKARPSPAPMVTEFTDLRRSVNPADIPASAPRHGSEKVGAFLDPGAPRWYRDMAEKHFADNPESLRQTRSASSPDERPRLQAAGARTRRIGRARSQPSARRLEAVHEAPEDDESSDEVPRSKSDWSVVHQGSLRRMIESIRSNLPARPRLLSLGGKSKAKATPSPPASVGSPAAPGPEVARQAVRAVRSESGSEGRRRPRGEAPRAWVSEPAPLGLGPGGFARRSRFASL